MFKQKIIFTFALTASLVLLSCSHGDTKQGVRSASQTLNQVIATYTDAEKRLDPFNASYFNVEEDLDKFGDYPTPAFIERSKKIVSDALQSLAAVDESALNESDARTYRLFKEDMQVQLKGYDYPSEYIGANVGNGFGFNQMSNRLHAYVDDSSESLTTFPFNSVKHYEDFVKRSNGFLAYVDAQIDQLRDGVKKGIVLSCEVVKQTPNSYADGLITDVEKNPFWRPITFMPKTFSDVDRERLKAQFREMIQTRLVPGYQKFDQYFKNDYAKHCRKQFGLTGLPHARDWYEYAIKSNTNLSYDAKTVHEIGLKEVARISGEIEKIKTQVGFKGTYQQFIKSLLTNPKYFFTSSKDMFDAFAKIKTDTAAKIPQFFSLIPKSDFKIVETSNPEDAAGSYNAPTEMLPFGRFVANTKNLRSVPTYEVTTLMLHETVPGHHFQLALQFEMKDQLSEYQRKLFNSNSFVEGWALYSEYLGNEMGMLTDPMQKLGSLNDEMLRAVRLVVDSGIHGYGWSQKKAREYMHKYLASDSKDINNEVNRYSVWPGQACSYKLGQLKIIELRQMAEKVLGTRFDVKDFHREVIGQGTVSLGELDNQVKRWVSHALLTK